MPRPLSELLPDDLWFPSCKQAVIAVLRSQAAPANIRRGWLFLWALWVGQRLNPSDYAKVTAGSIEAGPF